jgi:hypothetical protein
MDISEEIKCLSTNSKQWAINSGPTHIFSVSGDPYELGKVMKYVNNDQIKITVIFLELKSESNTFCIGLEGIRINSNGKIIDFIPTVKKKNIVSEKGNVVYITYTINLDTLTKNMTNFIKADKKKTFFSG